MKNVSSIPPVIAIAIFVGCGSDAEQPELTRIQHSLSVTGSFEGQLTDLSKDWGLAHSCLVWQQRGVVECFRTDEEMALREAELEQLAPQGRLPLDPTAEVACSSYAHLYEYAHRGGRHLQFRDRGYWQNLTAYGFSNMTTSIQNGGCRLFVAVGTGGGGTVGYYNPGVYSPNVGDLWNNRISSIYIQ